MKENKHLRYVADELELELSYITKENQIGCAVVFGECICKTDAGYMQGE